MIKIPAIVPAIRPPIIIFEMPYFKILFIFSMSISLLTNKLKPAAIAAISTTTKMSAGIL